MARKVKLAVFDIDGKASIGRYPISDSGDRIKVKKGGEGHFMPQFDHTSFIELPKKFLGLTIGSERVYFARKGSKKCVDFKTEVIGGPDPELVKIAAGSTMLKDLGTEKPPFPTWIIYFILLFTIGTALKVFGVIA